MGWSDWSGTDAIDNGVLGDVPQVDDYGTGGTTPDYGVVGSDWPNLTLPGVLTAAQNTMGYQQVGMMGGAAAALGGAAMRVSPMLFNAIVKISQRLGGASGSVLGYGRRVWANLSAWAAKNPGVSLVGTLASLGLTLEEAAHFIAWGATTKRKRRTRGINGRDIRTTRRTIRKLNSMRHLLQGLCGPVHHRVHHRRSK